MYDPAGFFSFEEPVSVHSHSMDTFERPRDTDQYLDPQQRYALSRTQSQQQVLPSFRDIIPAHLHNAIETAPQSAQSDLQSPTSTSTNLQAPSDVNRSNATSPIQSHRSAMPTFGEGMDDFSARPQDPNYQAMRRQADQIPTWTQQSSQYPEIPTVYSTQQTSMYQNQPYSSFRNLQALPSIHDPQPRSEKISNGMETNRSMAMSSYPPVQGYGQPAINRMDLQNGAFDSRRASSYYDQAQRHPQNYPPVVRHNGSNIDYQNPYQPRYDLYRPHSSYGGPYTDMEYSGQPAPVPQSSNFNMVGENVDSRGKRRRGNLPKPVTDILRAWFHEHLDHPYPTEEDKQQFMQRTGLTLNQISNWFINARRRQLPSLRQNRDRLQHRDRTDRYRSQESSIEPR